MIVQYGRKRKSYQATSAFVYNVEFLLSGGGGPPSATSNTRTSSSTLCVAVMKKGAAASISASARSELVEIVVKGKFLSVPVSNAAATTTGGMKGAVSNPAVSARSFSYSAFIDKGVLADVRLSHGDAFASAVRHAGNAACRVEVAAIVNAVLARHVTVSTALSNGHSVLLDSKKGQVLAVAIAAAINALITATGAPVPPATVIIDHVTGMITVELGANQRIQITTDMIKLDTNRELLLNLVEDAVLVEN